MNPDPEPGPLVAGFATWLQSGHGVTTSRARHVSDVREFMSWYDVNPHDDMLTAARQFGEFGSHQTASSMRLLLEWLAER